MRLPIDTAMGRELREIPSLLRRSAPTWQQRAEAAMAPEWTRPARMVVGRGSSGHAALYASDLLARTSGRPAIDLRPSQASEVTADRRDDDLVAWAFSASGESPDVVEAASWLRRRGAWVVGISNAVDHQVALARAADRMLWLDAGPERAVPATKSFVAQLFAGAALAGIELTKGAEEVASAVEAIFLQAVATKLAEQIVNAPTLVITSHGLGWTAAKDGALKLEEAAAKLAIALTPAELLHGPVGALGPGATVVWLWEAPPSEALHAQLSKTIQKRGASLVTVGAGALDFPLPAFSSTWPMTPILFAVLAECALQIALHEGRDPDQPPGLAKITRT